MAQTFVKAANEVLDYQTNWSDWLGADTISSSTWTADTGLTVDSDSNTTTTATVWLSGGTASEWDLKRYAVTNQIVTAAGRTAERIIYVAIPPAVQYCTLAEVKNHLDISSDTDDYLLWVAVCQAQAFIDAQTGRTFEAASDTAKTFDAVRDVDGRLLYVDDLASITSVTNGDGTTVTSGQYTTEPRRVTPYYAIRLLSSSGVSWTYTTDPEGAISITGKWAYSVSVPADIVQACKRLAAWLYRQRENRTGDEDRAIIAGSATILPSQVPSDVMQILRSKKRIS